ncbi:uncharacterized protein LOC133835531 [Drosophila sulfurigaster albostrigata]|uniref:uncharacterized protein LOC133835531 n=1 Tax=Drosophila sulfurigaster albostrigata TaxID=89887 RepID=UPI002D21EB6F|nr:uncharacterized protein LOC133835531 [Drosophila sulfurigaster albostrigata]
MEQKSSISEFTTHWHCNTQGQMATSPGPHIIIDTEFVLDTQFHKKFPSDLLGTATLQQLPTEIMIGDTKYILSGAIEYVASVSSTGIGHYIGYCLMITGCWERDSQAGARRRSAGRKCGSQDGAPLAADAVAKKTRTGAPLAASAAAKKALRRSAGRYARNGGAKGAPLAAMRRQRWR